MIQNIGGIVEVILSVAAITGGALYLPPLWSLFSKRQTGKSILTATLVSLAVNSIFKFATPYLIDLSLTRAQEMILGVVAPIVVLVLFELRHILFQKVNPDYNKYQKIMADKKDDSEELEVSDLQNSHGRKVISYGIIGTGMLIIFIGAFALTGRWLVIGAGLSIIVAGIIINPKK